jgi:hypothetical protein
MVCNDGQATVNAHVEHLGVDTSADLVLNGVFIGHVESGPASFSVDVDPGVWHYFWLRTGPQGLLASLSVFPECPPPVSVPEPSIPEPSIPEPSTPEPGTPEPSIPEPSLPEPGTPDPTIPEPGTPAPTVPDVNVPGGTVPAVTIPAAIPVSGSLIPLTTSPTLGATTPLATTLPETGGSAAPVAITGALLLGLGLVAHRTSRRPSDES